MADTDHATEAPRIRLDDALKVFGVVATGGEAKHRIQAGEVYVNGEIETRRKHFLVEGDTVRLGNQQFVIEFEPNPDYDPAD